MGQIRKPKEIIRVNSIRIGRLTVAALNLFAPVLEVAALPAKAQKSKIKFLIGLGLAISFCYLPALAQERNEVGLQIGGIVTPSQTLAPGVSLIGPGGTTLPTRDLTFNSSLTLAPTYDQTFFHTLK